MSTGASYDPCDSVEDYAERDGAKSGFIQGAEWMRKEQLDKVVEWLKENAQKYYYSSSQADNCYYDDEELVEDFKKAMEE